MYNISCQLWTEVIWIYYLFFNCPWLDCCVKAVKGTSLSWSLQSFIYVIFYPVILAVRCESFIPGPHGDGDIPSDSHCDKCFLSWKDVRFYQMPSCIHRYNHGLLSFFLLMHVVLVFILREPHFWLSLNPTHYGIQFSTCCWISLLGFCCRFLSL